MKIFISWSGPLSRQIAETLRDWLPSVLQTIEPYVSSEDIYKGARWSVDVSRELEAANYGILCVTATNINAPWLNFEAGALSKSFEEGHVSPFLFDIEPSNVTGPLSQFQLTVNERDDVHRLVGSINAVAEAPLASSRLHGAFEVWWPKLQEKLDSVKSLVPAEEQARGVKRPVEEIVVELLDLARAQQRWLYALSQRTQRPSSPTSSSLRIELEALQNLVEGLIRQGRLSSSEVMLALPDRLPSRKFRDWLQTLFYEVEPYQVEPSSDDSLPTEPASADSESSDDL